MSFSKRLEIKGHSGAIYTCAFDGEFIYTGSADKYVTRWDIEKGIQDKFAIKFDNSVYAIEVCEHLLFVGLSNGSLHIFDLNSKEELKNYTQHTQAIFSICYNPYKKQVYVGDAGGNLSVWNSIDLSLMIALPLAAGKIRDINIDAEGNHFVVSGLKGVVRIFDAEYFNEINTLTTDESGVMSILFHPANSKQIITGGKDALIKVWNLETGKEDQEVIAHNFSVYRLLSMNNGKTIISASKDKTVKIWDSKLNFIERLDFKVGGHRHSVNDIVKLNENSFVSCSDDRRIIVWDTKKDKL